MKSVFDYLTVSVIWSCLGLGLKKLFVSSNPSQTRFYSKQSLPLRFSALQTPKQHENCLYHKLSEKN